MANPTLKKEVEAAAIEHIECPSCGAKPGELCRKKLRGPRFRDLNATSNAQTHQRRLSAFISSKHCRFSTSRPIHVLKSNEEM